MRKSKTKIRISSAGVTAIYYAADILRETETKTTEPAADGTEADAAVATDAAAETDTAAGQMVLMKQMVKRPRRYD